MKLKRIRGVGDIDWILLSDDIERITIDGVL